MDFTLKVTISQGQRSLDVPLKEVLSIQEGKETNICWLWEEEGGSNETKQTDLSTWLHFSGPSFQSSRRAGGEVLVAPTLKEKPKLKRVLPTNLWWEKIRMVVAFGVIQLNHKNKSMFTLSLTRRKQISSLAFGWGWGMWITAKILKKSLQPVQ